MQLVWGRLAQKSTPGEAVIGTSVNMDHGPRLNCKLLFVHFETLGVAPVLMSTALGSSKLSRAA